MNIAVCAKQIPDPNTPAEFDPVTKTLRRDGKFMLDDSDRYGVEMALQLRDAAGGGEVVLISMAANSEQEGLFRALSMGADRAILISDPLLAGSDALSTAKVIAACARRIDSLDLVITATESTDGYTGTIPGQVAALLDWPSLTFAKHVEVVDGSVTVRRQTEVGFDVVRASLPAVVSVTAGVVEPRFPNFMQIKSAHTKPIEILATTDLGLTSEEVGWAGARQTVSSISPAPARASGTKIVDDGNAHEEIVQYLEQIKIL